jgi:thiamine-phosphate pyrophosphorylase
MAPLYAIVDVDACLRAGRSTPEVARAFLAGGARLLQIRAKHLAAGAFLRLVDDVAVAARAAGATLVVNDRVDVARAAGLGVHLGQDDLPVGAARAVLGHDAVVGLSTHTPAELEAALRLPISYVAYGPIFATATKAAPDPVVGLAALAAAATTAAAAGIPLVAIGGITLATAAAVRAQGAASVAVIGDLLAGAEGAAERVRRFLSALADTQPV